MTSLPSFVSARILSRGSSMGLPRFATWFAALGMVITLMACQSQPPLPQQRYELRGKVVAVDKSQGTVMVAHEAIPGFMSAMTMSYSLKDRWAFNILKPGQSIHATLVVTGNDAWLEGIVVTEEAKPESKSLAPGESGQAALGRELPDFQLINQDGKRIHLHQYHGKALLLTFIYTRCPLPDYCPLMSKNFAKIQDAVSHDNALSASTHLLSISIDPEHDEPAVLRTYGLGYMGKSSGRPFGQWEFASGTPEQVRKVAEFFGLKYWSDSGQIVHALVTALIGPDGKVSKLYGGNDWQPADVVSDLRGLPGATK
jgi:protein SCO1